jgi:hypothetical protein
VSMDYLRSSAHLQALLIEEGIMKYEQVSTPVQYLPNSEDRAKEAYVKYHDRGVDGIVDDFRDSIGRLQKVQEFLRRDIDKLQARIDAYERVILRLCSPPPPPTPEEELDLTKERVRSLVKAYGNELESHNFGGIVEDLKNIIGEFP